MTSPVQQPCKVINKRTATLEELANAVYVGRPSRWGNPFKVSDGYTRAEAVAKFRDWVWRPAQWNLRNAARTHLRGRNLECYCSPLLCHADIWLEIATTPMEDAA